MSQLTTEFPQKRMYQKTALLHLTSCDPKDWYIAVSPISESPGYFLMFRAWSSSIVWFVVFSESSLLATVLFFLSIIFLILLVWMDLFMIPCLLVVIHTGLSLESFSLCFFFYSFFDSMHRTIYMEPYAPNNMHRIICTESGSRILIDYPPRVCGFVMLP